LRKLALSAVLALTVVACAGEKAPAPESQPTEPSSPSPVATTPAEPECADLTGSATAEIVMLDFAFDPFCAIVSADQKLEFPNEGKNRHSFTVPKLDLVVLAGESKVTPKPIGEVLKPGETHTYTCKYHPPMTGELRVEP
jgi:plastocyanin